MIGFFGNDINPIADGLLFGKDVLTNNVGGIGTINTVEIGNCKGRYIYANNDMTTNPSKDLPTEDWGSTTIMKADLAVNVQAGNLSAISTEINSLLIKRAELDEDNYRITEWINIFNIPIVGTAEEKAALLSDIFIKDYFARNNTNYAYSIVPLLVEGDIIREGTPNEGETMLTVTSQFNGVFICSRDNFQKLYAGVSYDDMSTIQLTGVHETLGSTFPIVVANAQVHYHKSGISGMILNKEFYDNDELNRSDLVKTREEFIEFITDKKPKIIKDWNGNIWLVMITDDVSYSFANNWGMGLGNAHFNWTELGIADNEDDLNAAGLIGGINMEA